MPLLGLAALLIEVYFVMHAMKTGRQRWVFLIVFVPLVGCLAYFVAEMLPELKDSPEARKAKIGLKKALNPTAELRRLQANLAMTDSISNRLALADYYAQNGNLTEAIDMYERSLEGTFKEDPAIYAGLCFSCYYKKFYDKFNDYFGRLKTVQGGKVSLELRLLHARMLEEIDQPRTALEEYENLVKERSGEEARFRYAALLKKMGRTDEANSVFGQIVQEAEFSPKYYRNLHKSWIDSAKAELRSK
jgi:hypothetical protein